MKQDDDLIREIKIHEIKAQALKAQSEEDFMTFDSFKQSKERDLKREKSLKVAEDELVQTMAKERTSTSLTSRFTLNRDHKTETKAKAAKSTVKEKEAEEEDQLKKLMDGQKVLKQRENHQYTGLISGANTATSTSSYSSGTGPSQKFPMGAGFGLGLSSPMAGVTQQNTSLSFNFANTNNTNTNMSRQSDTPGGSSAAGYQYGFEVGVGIGIGFSPTQSTGGTAGPTTLVGEHTLVDEDNANIVKLDHIPDIKTVEEQVSSELDAMFQDLGQIVADVPANGHDDQDGNRQALVPTVMVPDQMPTMMNPTQILMSPTTTSTPLQASLAASAAAGGATVIVDYTNETSQFIQLPTIDHHPPTMLGDSPGMSTNPTVTSELSHAPLLPRIAQNNMNNATVIVDYTDSAPESGGPTGPGSGDAYGDA